MEKEKEVSSLSIDNEGKISSLSSDNEGKISSLSSDNEGQGCKSFSKLLIIGFFIVTLILLSFNLVSAEKTIKVKPYCSFYEKFTGNCIENKTIEKKDVQGNILNSITDFFSFKWMFGTGTTINMTKRTPSSDDRFGVLSDAGNDCTNTSGQNICFCSGRQDNPKVDDGYCDLACIASTPAGGPFYDCSSSFYKCNCLISCDSNDPNACNVGNNKCIKGTCVNSKCSYTNLPSGTSCSTTGGYSAIDGKCDGNGWCVKSCDKESEECRAANGQCDKAEYYNCDGTCPADEFKDFGVCRFSNGYPCDAAEYCDGSGPNCPADKFEPATYKCQSAWGDCQLDAYCTGTSDQCPANPLKSAGTVCRGSTGLCDEEEKCDGSNIDCPSDTKKSAGTVCRAATGLCEEDAKCDGSSSDCPSNTLKPSTTVCRASAGECDIEEKCTGSSKDCPSDNKKSAGTVCRAAPNTCKYDAKCNGNSVTCPQNLNKPNGVQCVTNNQERGWCYNGDCVPLKCATGLEGTCGEPKANILSCCTKGEECCPASGSSGEVCCKTGKEKCTENKRTGKYYCNPTQCKPGEKLCPADGNSDWNSCCKQDEGCLIKNNMGYCVKYTCDPDKEEPCVTGKINGQDVVECCKKGECQSLSYIMNIKFCKGKLCDSKTEHECWGTVTIPGYPTYQVSVCCKIGLDVCGTQPNGGPKCIPFKSSQSNPSSQQSNSIYMVRQKDNFTLDGIAYVITPHIIFNYNVTLTMKVYDEGKFETYKYTDEENVLDVCNYSIIDSISKNINIMGGVINYSDEISLNVPALSLGNEINFTIIKYDLSNCYIPGSNSYDIGKVCIPNCTGKQCGDDGCAGSCGSCSSGQTCNNITGQCVNIPIKQLLAFYPFEGNATDMSGNGNNGVVNGATFVSGKIGKAASFNGANNYINLGNKFNMTDQSTLSLWFNSNSFSGSKVLFSKQWQSNTAGFYVIYITANNSILYQYANGTAWKNLYFNKYTFNKNQWYHLTLIRDNFVRKVSLYVNGFPSMVNSYPDNALNINSGNALVGVYQTLAHYPFNGSIDEVKIWNYALNDSEIRQEYRRGILCTDSDGGINYALKGTLNYEGNILNDYCYTYNNNITLNYTLEYYCTNTSYSSTWYNCQFGCLNGACKNINGSICNNQCIAGEKKCTGNYLYSCRDSNNDGCLEWSYSSYCYAGCSNSVCINAPCTDSDGGINYALKGSIKFGNNTITSDFCSNKNLYEYYCFNSSTYSYNYTTCPINCLDGACSSIPPQCSETDNGFDTYNKGTTTYKNVLYMDYCSSKNLTEFYCSNDNKYSYNTSCYYGCLNGACKSSSAPATNCSDSDGGINYIVKGTLNYKNQSFNDYCYTYNNNITFNYTIEYYCTNTSYSSTWYNCQFGCLNGACKNINGSICNNQCIAGEKKCTGNYLYSCKDSNNDGCLEWSYSSYCYAGCSNSVCINAPCTDSDGGINYALKGSIKFGNNTITSDFCSNKNLYEYYCFNSSTYSYNYTTCPINCLDGACSSIPPQCSETDNGFDIYNKGTTTYKNVLYMDYCSSKNLTEFYCYNDYLYNYTSSCYYGCLSGACTSS